MSDDPAPRITAALETYISAKAIYGAALLETQAGGSEEWRVRAVMPQANAYMETLAPVCEALDAGWPAVLMRLAAAAAVIAAVKTRRTNGMLRQGNGKDDEHAITLALTAYNALVGTGEGESQ